MKVLAIADTHLTKRFDRRKCEILRTLIEGCDLLIVVGDFYEEHAMTFDDFLRSGWSELFPLMLSKNTVCIIGNHDTGLPGEAYERFCTVAVERYELDCSGERFVFTHGHRFDDKVSTPCKWPAFLRRSFSVFLKFACEILGPKHLAVYKPLNNAIKNWKRKNLRPTDWLITGHTHWAEVDHEARYANPGLFLSERIYSYLLIEDGVVSLRLGK